MNFENPLLLLLLIPLAGGVVFNKARGHWKGVANWFLIASVACLVLAAANPYWKTVPGQKLSREANFIFILDVSQSMFCREGNITRIEEATSLLKALLPQLSGTSISIVYFAGDAQLGTPATEDASAVRLFLDSIVPKMSAQTGTKTRTIPEVLAQITTADNGLAESQRKQVALLFSDGEFFDAVEPVKQWLKDNRNVTLFTFATGSEKAAVPDYTLLRPHAGAVSEPRRKELEELAIAGRGRMFTLSNATNPAAVLAALTTSARQIVSSGDSVPLYEEYPFLIASLFLLLMYQAFPLFRGGKLPHWKMAAVLSCFLVMTMAMNAEEKRATFTEALKAMEQKQYKRAVGELKKLESENPNAETEIALGNAYFYQDQFDTAIEHYRKALQDNPNIESARWNWEVALKRKSNPNSPPPPQTPPPPSQTPPEIPQESQALLKYSDQLERNQLKELNAQNSSSSTFEW